MKTIKLNYTVEEFAKILNSGVTLVDDAGNDWNGPESFVTAAKQQAVGNVIFHFNAESWHDSGADLTDDDVLYILDSNSNPGYEIELKDKNAECGHWKYDDDYIVREWTDIHGDVCRQMGNVWVEPYLNNAGGISVRETFVSTSDR